MENQQELSSDIDHEWETIETVEEDADFYETNSYHFHIMSCQLDHEGIEARLYDINRRTLVLFALFILIVAYLLAQTGLKIGSTGNTRI